MNDFDDDGDEALDGDELDDSVEALVWQLLLLINPGDEETAFRQFTAFRESTEQQGEIDDPVELLGQVIDWQSGFRAEEPRALVQALDELAARWNLSIDWGVDLDDEEYFDEVEAPDLLATAYDRLAEHGYTVWVRETPDDAYAGWITLRRDAEPMRELATALGINLRLGIDAT